MILSRSSADKMLRRMALEIAEHNFDKREIIIIGIKENGIFVARKIVEYLKEYFEGEIKNIELSVNKKTASDVKLNIETDLKNKILLLADDVANSGRTMLYAMQPLLLMHPAEIQTLALVERTHKLFPVALNYTGLSVSTKPNENIIVGVEEGEITGAWIS
jgi:pyrimidine operon attenuation protein / uracil phosphoribosyltransferase